MPHAGSMCPADTCPAVDGGIVYVASDDGKLYALATAK